MPGGIPAMPAYGPGSIPDWMSTENGVFSNVRLGESQASPQVPILPRGGRGYTRKRLEPAVVTVG